MPTAACCGGSGLELITVPETSPVFKLTVAGVALAAVVPTAVFGSVLLPGVALAADVDFAAAWAAAAAAGLVLTAVSERDREAGRWSSVSVPESYRIL